MDQLQRLHNIVTPFFDWRIPLANMFASLYYPVKLFLSELKHKYRGSNAWDMASRWTHLECWCCSILDSNYEGSSVDLDLRPLRCSCWQLIVFANWEIPNFIALEGREMFGSIFLILLSLRSRILKEGRWALLQKRSILLLLRLSVTSPYRLIVSSMVFMELFSIVSVVNNGRFDKFLSTSILLSNSRYVSLGKSFRF